MRCWEPFFFALAAVKVGARISFTTLYVNDISQGSGTCVRMPLTPNRSTCPDRGDGPDNLYSSLSVPAVPGYIGPPALTMASSSAARSVETTTPGILGSYASAARSMALVAAAPAIGNTTQTFNSSDAPKYPVTNPPSMTTPITQINR